MQWNNILTIPVGARMRSAIIAALVYCSLPVAGQTPETALDAYLNNGDETFRWEVKDSYDIGPVKAYNLLLVSQQWHEYVWSHQLIVLVPQENQYDGALLFVTGGSNRKGQPNWNKKDDRFT